MKVLICTDGTALSDSAVRLGAALAQAAQAEVALLGVARYAGATAGVRRAMRAARSLPLERLEEIVRIGPFADEILSVAAAGRYDLIVVGSRGRRGLARLLFTPVGARLAQEAPVPVLIVPDDRPQLRRVLACTGGGAPGERAARWGGLIAHWLKAEITVLHVMSQMPMSPDANVEELAEDAEAAMAHGTREGRHLSREVELLRAQGVPVEEQAQPKIRHGLVLDEIAAEVKEGDYDLVVIGAHETGAPQPGLAKLTALLLDDVADDVISTVNRPVLVVRGA